MNASFPKTNHLNSGSGCAVSISGLHYAYHHDKPVLDNISLDIQPGERFAIIGPSGAGKSTLLLHLNGILMSHEGKITVDDLKITQENLPRIRQKVGLVFQNPDDQLFNPTVAEDISFGPLNLGMSREQVAVRVSSILEEMHLEGKEAESSHHLSYGERKRVALATVLVMDPELIAFDEPFSNLDPAMVQQLVQTIARIPATVIMVSQSILPALACCHRVAVLQGGQIRIVATVPELVKKRDLLKECGVDFEFYCRICRNLHEAGLESGQ